MKLYTLCALLGLSAAVSLRKEEEPKEKGTGCAYDTACYTEQYQGGDCFQGADQGCVVNIGGRGGRQATLGAAARGGSFATLGSESAGSETRIGAQQIVIPDRHTVTDQTKVSESCSSGSNSASNVEVAKRTFDIAGSISVTENYQDKAEGQHAAQKEGEGASQTRSRSQVCNNVCAKAQIPCTCAPSKGC
jgi:hypothetical protein